MPIWYNISKIPKFNMDYNFHSRILLADAHSKHILITLVIDSQNFRKLQKFERDEDRTQNRKSNSLPKKTWNFSRMSILKPQNSISWAGGITNEIMLWNEIKVKNRSNLTPIKPLTPIKRFADTLQAYVAIFCTKNTSLRIVSKSPLVRF